jgi:hypothetical protein
MLKRLVLTLTVVVLLGSQTMPAAADTGFTSNDFRVTHAVADIGATTTVTVQGTIDRDLWGAYKNLQPSFDLQQSCQNLVTPTDTIVATRTINYPFLPIQRHSRGATRPTGQVSRLDRHGVL